MHKERGAAREIIGALRNESALKSCGFLQSSFVC
jgi:hypothetical protein